MNSRPDMSRKTAMILIGIMFVIALIFAAKTSDLVTGYIIRSL